MIQLKRILEAVFFSSSRPLKFKVLEKKLSIYSAEEIAQALEELTDEYRHSDRAIEIVSVSGGYQMRTKIIFREWVARFVKEKDVGLTRPMLETLSLIAYKQPITKREIDLIRGVDSTRMIRQLLERRLIEIAGRTDDVGKPIIFRTTDAFLDVYGLKDIGDLPTLKEMEALEN